MPLAPSTATLNHPTATAPVRHRPAASRVSTARVPATGLPAAALSQRISEPDGLTQWRENLAGLERVVPPTIGQVRKVLSAVRDGLDLSATARRARISQARTLDVVVGVGSRISQANKSGPRAAKCLSAADGARVKLAAGQVVTHKRELVAVLAEGWDRNAGHGRDLGRAYSAILLSDPESDDRPIDRWLATLASTQEVTYATYAHLMAVATGKMRTFTGLTDDPDVQDAYLRAFDSIADIIAEASAAVGRLSRGDGTAEQIFEDLKLCYWMVPDARILGGLAKAAIAGDPVAGSKLRVALGNLRSTVSRRPTLFFPRALSDLSARQYRSILAQRGYHPDDMADAARSETDFSDLSSTLAAIREKVLEGVDLEDAAEEVTRLAATWHGLDA